MTFKTFQYADISTVYLAESDLPLIIMENAPYHLANINDHSGSFFYLPDSFDDRVPSAGDKFDKTIFKEFGFSNRFITIMKELYEQRIPYVRFDANGADVEGFIKNPLL